MPEPALASTAPPTDRRRMLRTIAEGKRLEAYAEQQTAEMRTCFLCERVVYRRKPMKKIGQRWVCIDCLRSLKESIDTLDRWEQLTALHDRLERDVEFKR